MSTAAQEIERAASDYTNWCLARDCHHAHCPFECEHPQPFMYDEHRLVCGRCFFEEGKITEMVACKPEACEP